MPRQIQFDQFVEPVSTAKETVTADRWVQPWSQPYDSNPVDRRGGHPRAAGSYRAALYSPCLASPISTAKETVTEDRWHQPASQPYDALAVDRKGAGGSYRAALYLPAFWQRLFTTPELPWQWYQPWSLPAKPGYRDDLYNSGFSSPFTVTTPEDVTPDKWLQPWPQPLRKQFSWAPYDTSDGMAAEPISEPEAVGLNSWFQPWTQPLRKQFSWATLDQVGADELSTSPENVSEDRWHQPQSQPYPSKPALRASLNPSLSEPVSVDPENVTIDRWFQPFSQPFRVGWRDDLYNSGFSAPFVQPVVSAGTIEWFQAWNQPNRKIFSWATYDASDGSSQPISAPEDVNVASWFPQFAQPVRSGWRDDLYNSGFCWSGTTKTLNAPGDQPWSQPSGTRPWNRAVYSSTLFEPVSVAPENVTVDRWFQPFSQPIRTGWRDDLYNSGFASPLFVATGTTVSLEWLQPWQSQRKPLAGTGAQSGAVGPVSTVPENVSADRFVQPTSQPLGRVFSRATYSVASAIPFPTAVVSNTIEWFEPWADPKRKLAVGSVAEIQPVSTSPETVTADRWTQPQSQPYPARPWNRAVYASTLVQPRAETVIDSSWLQPTCQPTPARFPRATYASGSVYVAPFVEQVFVDKWFAPWSVPVRRRVSYVLYDRYFNAPGLGQATIPEVLAVLGGSVVAQLESITGSVTSQLGAPGQKGSTVSQLESTGGGVVI